MTGYMYAHSNVGFVSLQTFQVMRLNQQVMRLNQIIRLNEDFYEFEMRENELPP